MREGRPYLLVAWQAVVAVSVIAASRGQVAKALLRQRPRRRPLPRPFGVEGFRLILVAVMLPVPIDAIAELIVAEQQVVVGMDGRLADVDHAAQTARVIALEEAGIAFERLADRAGLGLGVCLALAARPHAERGAEEGHVFDHHREVVAGAVDAFDVVALLAKRCELPDHAGDRADVVLKTPDGLFRRYRAMSGLGRKGASAGLERDDRPVLDAGIPAIRA